jgi:hypothetical protein
MMLNCLCVVGSHAARLLPAAPRTHWSGTRLLDRHSRYGPYRPRPDG